MRCAVAEGVRTLRRLARSRPAPLLAVLVIFLVDALLRMFDPPFLVVAIFDESGHAATTLLLLMNVTAPSGLFAVAALLASTAIDLDHIPYYLEWGLANPELVRPRPHSLASVALALVVGLLARGRVRQVALGVAFGVSSHLLRDMATGGISLFWPLTFRVATYPYALYAFLMAGLAAAVLLRTSDPARDGRNRPWWTWRER